MVCSQMVMRDGIKAKQQTPIYPSPHTELGAREKEIDQAREDQEVAGSKTRKSPESGKQECPPGGSLTPEERSQQLTPGATYDYPNTLHHSSCSNCRILIIIYQ